MDTVRLNIPLFIRLLELAREELTSDYQIHLLVEHIAGLKQDCLSMKDYEKVIMPLVKKS